MLSKGKLRYWWTALYFPVYMFFFTLAEKMVTEDFHVINIGLDDRIPFVEWFIFPYYIWFPFMAVFFVLFFFRDKEEYIRMIALLYAGMTIFLIISFAYPNGLTLRPETFSRDNLATVIVSSLYGTDTPTNVFPSIHVFNTLGVLIAVWRSKKIAKHRLSKWGITVLGSLIICSTVFLKQHSVVDVLGAFVMAAVLYFLVYRGLFLKKTK